MKELTAAALCALVLTSGAIGIAIGARATGHAWETASGDVTPADPVKEYAMNRLCKISVGECKRLAHIIIASQRPAGTR